MMRALLACMCCVLLAASSVVYPAVYAQEDQEYDTVCDIQGVVDACHTSPGFLQEYLDRVPMMLSVFPTDVAPAQVDVSASTVTTITNGRRANSNSSENKILNGNETLDDIFSDQKILNHSKTIQRDRKKLEQIDALIDDTRRQLDENQTFTTQVSPDLLKKLDDLLAELGFINLTRKSGSYNMERSQKSVGDALYIVRQLNQLYKGLYRKDFYRRQLENVGNEFTKSYFDAGDKKDTAQEKEALSSIVEDLERTVNQSFVLSIGEQTNDSSVMPVTILYDALLEKIRQTELAYRCADGPTNNCEDGTKDVRKNNRTLMKRFIVDMERSLDTIRNANKRLSDTLTHTDADHNNSKKENSFSIVESPRSNGGPEEGTVRGPAQSAEQLIGWMKNGFRYGQDAFDADKDFSVNKTSEKPQTDLIGTTANSRKAKKLTDKEMKKEAKEVIEANEEKNEKKLGENNQQNLSQQNAERLKALQTALLNTVDTYIVDAEEEINQDLLYADTKVMTKSVVALSKHIHAAANIIGDYDDASTINYTLAKMCETQCSNVTNKLCRSDHK